MTGPDNERKERNPNELSQRARTRTSEKKTTKVKAERARAREAKIRGTRGSSFSIKFPARALETGFTACLTIRIYVYTYTPPCVSAQIRRANWN